MNSPHRPPLVRGRVRSWNTRRGRGSVANAGVSRSIHNSRACFCSAVASRCSRDGQALCATIFSKTVAANGRNCDAGVDGVSAARALARVQHAFVARPFSVQLYLRQAAAWERRRASARVRLRAGCWRHHCGYVRVQRATHRRSRGRTLVVPSRNQRQRRPIAELAVCSFVPRWRTRSLHRRIFASQPSVRARRVRRSVHHGARLEQRAELEPARAILLYHSC